MKTTAEQKMENREPLSVDPRFEGLLDKDGGRFNGVVFLMREPNTDDRKVDSFWFRECLADKENVLSRDYKGNFKKYKNKFVRLLSYVFPDKSKTERKEELSSCAYFNLRSDGGSARMTREYKELRDDPSACKFRFDEQILKNCKDWMLDDHDGGTLHIFTCQDILNALQKHSIIPNGCDDLTKANAVTFEHGKRQYQRDYVQFTGDDIIVRVYAIDHPSYSSRVCEKGE